MNISGTIHHIGLTETVGANGFQKRLVVINTGGKYDNLVPVEAVKNQVGLLDSFQISDVVNVDVTIGGREYNGRYYPSIRLLKIEGAARMQQQVIAAPIPLTEEIDEMPF